MKLRGLKPAARKFPRPDKPAANINARIAKASRSELERDHAFALSATSVYNPFPNLNYRNLDALVSNGPGRTGSHNVSTLRVFSPRTSASSSNWKHKVAQKILEPRSKDFLSILQHSHLIVNATLSQFPTAQHTRLSHNFNGRSRHATNYTLRCVASRDDSRDSSDRTKFCLRIATFVDKKVGPIGPRKSTLDSHGVELTIEIQMTATPAFFSSCVGNSEKKSLPSLNDLATKLVHDMRTSLCAREFTSNLSWKEAAALHLEHALETSALKQYVNFDELTLSGFELRDLYRTQWVHGRCRSKILPYKEPIDLTLMPDGMKLRREYTPRTSEGNVGLRTPINQATRKTILCQVHGFNVDLSVIQKPEMPSAVFDIASHFERRCSESPSKDLTSMLDSFHAVVQKFPRDVKNPVIVKISQEAPETPRELGGSKGMPTFSLELRQAAVAGSTSVSLHVDLQKSFELRFTSAQWKKRPILIKRISLQMSPIDAAAVSSLGESPIHDQLTIAHEARHLIDSASSIIGRVCEAVEFDDTALVPGMLAEAILRLARPKTTCFEAEEVTVDVIVGDEPVSLIKTVSLADLDTTPSRPQRYVPHVDKVHFPSCYSSHITHQISGEEARKNPSSQIGFFSRSMQLISSAIADYESVNPLQTLIDSFEDILGKSKASDIFTLQSLVQNALETVHGGEDAVLILEPPRGLVDASGTALSLEGPAMTVYSDGEIVCRLQVFEQVFWCDKAEPAPIKCQLWLTGTPTRQIDGHIDAHGQISLMHEILARRLAEAFKQHVFSDAHEAANEIAEVSYDARSELAKHMIVQTITAKVKINLAGLFKPPVQANTIMEHDENRQAQTGEVLWTPATDIDGSDLEQTNLQGSIDSPVNGKDLGRGFCSLGLLKQLSEHDPAVALQDLLRELDGKLLSITSLHSNSQAAHSKTMHPTGKASDTSITSKNLKRGSDSLNLSKESSEHDHAAALKDLLRDLDGKIPSFPSKMQRGVVIALGSNLGNRIEEIEKACRAIDADTDMRIVDTSFLYETKPMYVEDQGEFVNGACEIETSLSPIQLLDRLQAIEQGHGRVKLVDKGPRNIDLDIAIFRNQVVETERLTIPHMLMHEREFVLRPIMDLEEMRDWRNPRTKMRMDNIFGNAISPTREQQHQEPMRVITPLTTDALIYPLDKCRKTRVMSILNTTPDSFSDGGSNALDLQSLRETAAAHIAAGATIIDVGGQSSRPNAPDVTAEEEIDRVLPAIAAIKSLPEADGIAISVDTYRAAVAEAAVNAGAHIVNDISAGTLDPKMLSTVARLGCTYVMMHMRGTPATMQDPENCVYEDGVQSVVAKELYLRASLAIESGIRKWRIMTDPGIGFAKTQEQNLELLFNPALWRNRFTRGDRRRLVERQLRSMPQLFGCSRKGFIGNITGVTEPKDRVWGTAAAVTASIRSGADIVRVHDVEEMVQVSKMADAIYRNPYNSH